MQPKGAEVSPWNWAGGEPGKGPGELAQRPAAISLKKESQRLRGRVGMTFEEIGATVKKLQRD